MGLNCRNGVTMRYRAGGWHKRYWEIVDRYYWMPDRLGLQALRWIKKDGLACVPLEKIDQRGRLYARRVKAMETKVRLQKLETPLNDVFNLTFAIAPDSVISRVLFAPVGMPDNGSFESYGTDFIGPAEWQGENVTEHDGFFASDNSILAVELKLDTWSSRDQLIKYISLIVCEELDSKRQRVNLGLLFIVPEHRKDQFWTRSGFGPILDGAFPVEEIARQSNPHIKKHFENYSDHFRSVANRLKMHVITWRELVGNIDKLCENLDRSGDMGEQTIYKLLHGFREYVRSNPRTRAGGD